ncbi:hypothetical protein RFI_15261 [Reticulomyxa filosa]|uniref:Uncharacterized protein n=1 Tax=Reticulomyxa filosa TaxID=46433 RepID=X6N7R8_RETFI|nr:hypothetical protein RFI_15261 [Reticulomyxa filosa]|eukprot:ETO21943.1 hypothetical protein RFI_15261 [Reticulomyxa filosa]
MKKVKMMTNFLWSKAATSKADVQKDHTNGQADKESETDKDNKEKDAGGKSSQGSKTAEPGSAESDITYNEVDLLGDMPSLRDTSDPEKKRALFIKKLKLCCVVFDFSVPDKVVLCCVCVYTINFFFFFGDSLNIATVYTYYNK